MNQPTLFAAPATETRRQQIRRLLERDRELWQRELRGQDEPGEVTNLVRALSALGVEFHFDPDARGNSSDSWVDTRTGHVWPSATRLDAAESGE